MQTLTTYVPFEKSDFPYWISAPATSLLCDIETCGFSARTSMIYMIGCGCFEDGQLRIDQYFAESKEEEAEILTLFASRLSGVKTLYTFNGTGFDLPFLRDRMQRCNIACDPTAIHGCDLFKEISSLKKLIHLENYKQKTVERFLGIDREDAAEGGELIDVYRQYQKVPDREALGILFLHNREDVAGMAGLLSLYRYHRLLQGPLELIDSKVHTYSSGDGSMAFELMITLKGCCRVPVRATVREEDFYLTAEKDRLLLRLPVIRGELRHYYQDYKNYYYLPEEDRAVHKSIAASVDTDYRCKCKASNCYVRQEGFFLPQNQVILTPDFYFEYKSHPAYFEMTEDFFREPANVLEYGKKIVEWVLG